MAYNTSPSFDFYRVFQASVITLSQLNEWFSCLNPWIVTPSPPSANSSITILPLITTVVYAIIEPLLTKYLIHVAIRPWILLLALSPIHLWWTGFSMDAFDWLHRTRYDAPSAVPSDSDKLPKSEEIYPNKVYVAMTLLVPVFTAAAINAALLLFTQSLRAPSLLEKNPLVTFLAPFAVVVYLICRVGDYMVWSRTQQGRSLSQFASRDLIGALIFQTVLFGIRAGTRSVLGLAPLMPFEILSRVEAETRFGSEQYQWIEGLRLSPLARKVQLVLALGSPFLMLLGRHLMMKASREDLKVTSQQK